MPYDRVIWDLIGCGSCSFKNKCTETKTIFCTNPYNSSGLCSPVLCPLANKQYATVNLNGTTCDLLIKEVERAHTPYRLWERIPLQEDLSSAKREIADRLEYFEPEIRRMCLKRIRVLYEIIKNKQEIERNSSKELHRVYKKKVERREKKYERRAEAAAKVTLVTEAELLNRFRSGVYGTLYSALEHRIRSKVSMKRKEKAKTGDTIIEKKKRIKKRKPIKIKYES